MSLSAAQIGVVGPHVMLGDGVSLSTIGKSVLSPDISSGFLTAGPLVRTSNLYFADKIVGGATSMEIGDGVTLLTGGQLSFDGDNIRFAGAPRLGAAALSLSASSINIGTANALDAANAAGLLPSGLNLSQDLLRRLLAGDAAAGVPAIKSLRLAGNGSIDFYGTVDLDTIDPLTGKSRLDQFILNTPAIYGYGTSDDHVRITADTLIWGGLSYDVYDTNLGHTVPHGYLPGALIDGGAGTGAGAFTLAADKIILGYPAQAQPNTSLTSDRLTLGFQSVTLDTVSSISANANQTLSVFASGPNPDADYRAATYAGIGGRLDLTTPLVTGDAGSSVAYRTGGVLTISPGEGRTASKATNGALGASLTLSGTSISDSSTILMPSGIVSIAAIADVSLEADSRIDVSGRTVSFFDVDKYSWGGAITLDSATGNVVQAAGSLIDVSAANSDAGALTVSARDATAGRVALGGTLRGSGGGGDTGGVFNLQAAMLNDGAPDPAFAALNATLDTAGFNEGRSFTFSQGDLTIGQSINAHQIGIVLNGGSLIVNSVLDASGAKPGTIRLAARNDLTLGSAAVLDAHGTVLQTDSKGIAIDANNRGTVELAAARGTLKLTGGATIDLSSPDGVARGHIVLNAPRTGPAFGASMTAGSAPANATSTDVAISASGTLDLRGAESVVLNGFATYSNAPTDANDPNGQVIDPEFLGLIDRDNQTFMGGALGNAALQQRIVGLTAYGDAFHLRAGVEIDSATSGGNLTVAGDLDLSGYRYGPAADRDPTSASYGAGEPMTLVIRAGGNLSVKGNINDGFAPPPLTGYEQPIVIPAGYIYSDVTLTQSAILAPGTMFNNTPCSLSTSIFLHPRSSLAVRLPRTTLFSLQRMIPMSVEITMSSRAITAGMSQHWFPGRSTIPIIQEEPTIRVIRSLTVFLGRVRSFTPERSSLRRILLTPP